MTLKEFAKEAAKSKKPMGKTERRLAYSASALARGGITGLGSAALAGLVTRSRGLHLLSGALGAGYGAREAHKKYYPEEYKKKTK